MGVLMLYFVSPAGEAAVGFCGFHAWASLPFVAGMGQLREPFFAKVTKGRRAGAIDSAMTVWALVGVGADGWENLGCVKGGFIGKTWVV